MPNLTITVSTGDLGRVKPAVRSAYGPILDPDGLLTDSDLVTSVIKHHLQRQVKDYERSQAEAAIAIPDLD